MVEAFLWGLFAASSLLIGALIAVGRPPQRRMLGLIMAFGAGVLLSAVSFELIAEATDVGGGGGAVVTGIFAGAAAFTIGDILIGRFQRRRQGNVMPDSEEGAGLSILLGRCSTACQRRPFSASLCFRQARWGGDAGGGLHLQPAGGVAATTTSSKVVGNAHWSWRSGARWCWPVLWRQRRDTCCSMGPRRAISFVFAFSGGAVLTMLATSLIPEAYEHADSSGRMTVFGFILAYGIHLLEG